MTSVLVDINVFIDVLERRDGWTDSIELISRVRKDQVEAWISALTIPIIYFLRSRYSSEADGRSDAATITQGFSIVPLTEEIIASALASELPDFEDNIQLFSAIDAGVDHIVTRNVVHFQQAMVEVVTPPEFLAILANEEDGIR